MGSGLIYLIIVGMWIAYFLPRWIANHEELSAKSVERFAYTMKLVGRTLGSVETDLTELQLKKENQVFVRRILFTSIFAFTVIVSLFILVGLLSPMIIAIPISGLGLYLVHARHQIRAMRAEIETASNPTRNLKTNSDYALLIARSKRLAKSRDESIAEQWTPLAERFDRSIRDIHGITIIPKGSAESRKTWEPNSIPAPLYQGGSKAVLRRQLQIQDEEILREVLAPSPDEIFDQDLAEEAAEQIRLYRAANE